MQKGKKLTLMLFLIVFSSAGLAQKILRLQPNENKTLKNSMFWTLKAKCSIQSKSDTQGKIKIEMLKNSGSVNGRSLTTGQSASIMVSNDTMISVSAESGTEINLVNLSEQSLEAICST